MPKPNGGKTLKIKIRSRAAVQTLDNILDKIIIKNCPLELLTERTKDKGSGWEGGKERRKTEK